MSDEEKKFNVLCGGCGIEFGFSEKIEATWRKSHKVFFCPNGHTLYWNDPDNRDKEIAALKDEIKQLKAKIEATRKEADVHKKIAEELVIELELWKPSSGSAA